MVRVISVHHFTSQDVTSVPPPVATAMAGQHLLLVATDSLQVEVRDLKKAAKVTHTFQTIDQVSQLAHCPIGNYVATLEGKPGEKGASVRIYCNWDDPRMEGAPIRPRIASRVTPSLRCDNAEDALTLDMIEFPHRDSPLTIAVCPSTGNFMVAAVNVLVIYKYSMKTQEMSKAKFLDFEDCIHIFHNFVPKEVTLVEDVIGCLSDHEVHVFKVKLVDCSEEKTMRSISVYSFSSESDSSSIIDPWTGASRVQPNTNRRNSSSDTDSSDNKKKLMFKNVTVARTQDSEANETHHLPGYTGNVKRHVDHVLLTGSETRGRVALPEIERANREFLAVSTPRIMEQSLGPRSPPAPTNGTGRSSDIIIKLVPTVATAEQDFMIEAEAVTLVHCKLLKSEEQHEQLKNLQIKPVYWREFRVKKSSSESPQQQLVQQHPLQSQWHPHLMSLTTCFTSLNEGYVYHLPGHIRKPGRGLGVQRIAVYPFTSPVGRITLESPTMMHALTQTGLETYTLRSGYSTVQEAETIDCRTRACPAGDTPICLVGLRPFLGTKLIVSSSHHLVLLASADQDKCSNSSKKWTIYSLSLPTPLALFKDMIQLANMNRSLSPHGYHQLLCEAHIVLRTSCHSLSWLMATSKDDTTATEEQLRNTRDLYQDSCLLLANYYAMSTNPGEYKLALPYYRMSCKPILMVLKQSKTMWKSLLPPGLVHYITEIILNPTESEDILEATLADMMIELLGEHALDTLAEIVLKSPTFRQFKTNKIHAYLKAHLESSLPGPVQVLAFAVLSVDKGSEGEEARAYLQSLSPVNLSEIVLEHHTFLLDEDNNSFSELALLIRDSAPTTFVEILVSLIKSDIFFTLPMVLHLLIGSMVSIMSCNSGGSMAHDAAMLQLFLESYFTDVLQVEEDECQDLKKLILDGDQLQALHTLVRSYLTSLSVPVRFGEKNIDCNMFGTRRLFLDQLPPFDHKKEEETTAEKLEESSAAEAVLLSADSPDFWCQNSLLKLQSLLCSPLCKGQSCKSIVQGFLDLKPDTIGALSLKILCLEDDNKAVIPLLVQGHPEVILPFAKEMGSDLDTWKLILKGLEVDNKELDEEEAKHDAMQEILNHLAQHLILESFLEILPDSQHNEDFQGYIQLCRKNQQAHQIQNLIVTTGHKLLSTLTF